MLDEVNKGDDFKCNHVFCIDGVVESESVFWED